MKKSILIAIISVFALIGTNTYGQASVTTLSITQSQDTTCVGTPITLQYQINNLGATTMTLVGCCKIEFNNMVTPTILGATPNFTVIIPGLSSTTVSPITGTIPAISNGLYNIRVKIYQSCTTPGGGTVPNTPNKVYAMNAPTTPTITSSGSTSLCPSTSVQLTSSGVGTYSWSTGATTQTISGTAPNTYTVKVSNMCGNATSSPISITQIPLPTISVSGATVGCGSVSLNASASNYTAINWSNGQTGVSATATTSTNYYATAVNSCGSFNSNTIAVTVNTLPVINATTSNSLLCVGQTATLTASGANTYTWNIGQTTNSATVNPTVNTTYTVVGTNLSGCSNYTQITQNVTICTGIENSLNNQLINKLYPVPANDKLNIELSNINEDSNVMINIYSIEGKKVLSEKMYNNNIVLDVSAVEPGMYIVEIVSNSWKSTKSIAITR